MRSGDLGQKVRQHLEEVVEEDLKAAEQIPVSSEDDKLAKKLLEDLHAEGGTLTIDPAVSGHWM